MSLARIEDRGDRLVVVNANTRRRGALSPDLYTAITQACATAREDRIRAVVLTSEAGFFCSGGDLTLLQERRSLPETERRNRVEALHDVIRALRTCPVPVIAAIEGGAAGAGVSLALACDLTVSGENAHFTAAYVKAGLVPDGGLTAALARLVPRSVAMELCLLGQPISAQRLFALGALTRTVAEGTAFDVALALADAICAGPPHAQTTIKGLVNAAYNATEAAQMDVERDAMVEAVVSPEAAEGMAAFLEKRQPSFAT